MKRNSLLLLFVMFVFVISVLVVKAAESDKSPKKGFSKNMQANPKKVKFMGRNEVLQEIYATSSGGSFKKPTPKFSKAVAFDSSPTLKQLAKMPYNEAPVDKPEDLGFAVSDSGFSGDSAVQSSLPQLVTIPGTSVNFEGLSNEDNFAVYGGRVNPPDPDGDVGPNHYVEIINLVVGIYNKQGTKLLGPIPIGAFWLNFPIADCTDASGDGIVLYDQHVNRWIVSQFTTAGPEFFNCVAVSKTPDPLGAYYRYAFSAGVFFPDYPKYGVWTDSYTLTSRDFGPVDEYGISVYALEKAQMISGNPSARAVQFFLDYQVVGLDIIGDGLLPADWDGTRRPQAGVPIPIVGTQDDDAPYGATFDALNIYNLSVLWNSEPLASLELVDQIPVASFDSIYPCAGGGGDSRDCLPQPTVVDPTRELDILSYRQRPTWRLAYRNFGTHEAMVTNQSVEAAPEVAGARWYEIRRNNLGEYSLFQQGTFAPGDGVHRWMGSIAMDKVGNMALGYSVVNATTVFPGIRYTGRLNGDAPGQMTLGEAVVIDGTGAQMTINSRWGDYTSMHIDPKDDCTFWYVNEYYEVSGVIGVNTVPWQTRIGAFKYPDCK